jgi:hypothetical protein
MAIARSSFTMKKNSSRSEAVEALQQGYLPRIPVSLALTAVAFFVTLRALQFAYKSFRPGPKPEMFRDYYHT